MTCRACSHRIDDHNEDGCMVSITDGNTVERCDCLGAVRPLCMFRLNYEIEGGAEYEVSMCKRDAGHEGPHLFGNPDRHVSELAGF